MAKLYFYYSAMNAGKSTNLLQSSYNYQERGMRTLLFTPEIDNRYRVGEISSRIGLQAEAHLFNEVTDLFAATALQHQSHHPLHCVLVDEAHFLTKAHIGELCKITDELDIPVLAYGLRSDFRGEPFSGSLYLLAWADKLIELKTVCHCGSKATMNLRVDKEGKAVTEGAQVEIGDTDRYVSLCRKHFWQAWHAS